MFYKIVFNDMIIDAVSDPVWVIWLKRAGRFQQTDRSTANGVVMRDGSGVYNIAGKGTFTGYDEPFKTVSVVEITEPEYESLMAQITTGADGEIENHEPTETEILQQRIDELGQLINDVAFRGDGLAEQLEAAKILLGVE